MHVHKTKQKVDTSMQCKYVSSHIALDVFIGWGPASSCSSFVCSERFRRTKLQQSLTV